MTLEERVDRLEQAVAALLGGAADAAGAFGVEGPGDPDGIVQFAAACRKREQEGRA